MSERLSDNDLDHLIAYLTQFTASSAEEARVGLIELRERRAADQWQPIETAPKDGTRVLVARYMPPYGWILGHANWRVVREVSGWVSHGLGAFGELGLADPTHWRPLPAPPVPAPAPEEEE